MDRLFNGGEPIYVTLSIFFIKKKGIKEVNSLQEKPE